LPLYYFFNHYIAIVANSAVLYKNDMHIFVGIYLILVLTYMLKLTLCKS